MIHEINQITGVCEMEVLETAEQLMSSSSEGASRLLTARRAHLAKLKHHEVSETKEVPPGVRPMTVRWVDRDDGSTAKSRLTARGYEQRLRGDEEFYSPTPLATTLRTMLVVAFTKGYSVAVGDCQDAFLQAPIQEEGDVWVWPPAEAGEAPGMAWLLKKTLPGLKGGPSAWGNHVDGRLTSYGLTTSKIDPCLCSCLRSKVAMVRHMDDFLQIGPKRELKTVQEKMKDEMLLRDIVYLDKPGDTVQFLGWRITRTAGGFDLSVNEQLAKDIIADAGLENTTRKTLAPGMKERVTDETPCDSVEHRYFRTQVGRLLYYGALRGDMQFAIKELAKDVQAPTQASMFALKRCIRYLRGTMHYVLRLRPRGRLRLTVYADSDWAGTADRRSTSGGILLLAGCCTLSYARTQASRAQSSCEAELYAIGSAAAEALQSASLLAEQGWSTEPPLIYSDSSSALTLVGRQGQGRLKHVEIRLLAIQDWKAEGRLRTAKVDTLENPSDLMTKHVTRATLDALCPLLGVGEP